MNIQETWFYQTNLKNYTELQDLLVSDSITKMELKSILLSGSVGAGKTYNAILAAKKYIETKFEENKHWHYSFEPVFISYMQYLEYLNNLKFGNDEQKSRAFYALRDLEDTPFLIFDDLRCQHASAYEKTTVDNALLNLLSVFWANRASRTVIVTTNNNKDELKESYSDAVCSRLFGLCEYIEVQGSDKRSKNLKA